MTPVHRTSTDSRIQQIEHARQFMMQEGKVLPGALADRWLERSWQRCLDSGKEPQQAVSFDVIAPQALRRTLEANRLLVRAARPVLEKLGRAIAGTRYFALLTNEQGVVVDVNGAFDRRDRRADLITRIGTDLSEPQLGTTAISAALSEQVPVWLHRGEHFFDANSVYSCAGAPLFGPDGGCVGMLDLTGIEATERPELKHLVSQSARRIENALMLGRLDSRRGLLIRLNWPGSRLEADTDGLICLDTDGLVTGANQTARQMVPQLGRPTGSPLHCSDLFAMAFERLFDAAQLPGSGRASAMEVPLWSGLRLQALPVLPGQGDVLAAAPVQASTAASAPAPTPRLLKEVETALIRKAVDDARGNVLQAAKALGVSRATVYRRLGSAKPGA